MTILLVILFAGHLIWNVGEEGSTTHYTILFNTFVLCQIFNEINSRKVNDGKLLIHQSTLKHVEWNIVEKMHTNWMFLLILGVTVVLQILIVELAGSWAATSGLTVDQWFSCIAMS